MLPFDEGTIGFLWLMMQADDMSYSRSACSHCCLGRFEGGCFSARSTRRASWDVEELAKGDVRKRIDEDLDYLRISVVGFPGSKRAAH
jgi:hypothetical protein